MRTVLIVALSLDGFITRHGTPGAGWASPADQTWFRRCLAQFDVNVMGRITYDTVRLSIADSLTPSRLRIVMTRNPAEFAASSKPGELEFSAQSAPALIKSLSASGRKQCAVLGGAQIHDAFLAAGLVDEIWATIEPRIFGQGTPLILTPRDVRLSLIDYQRLPDSDSLVARYRLSR